MQSQGLKNVAGVLLAGGLSSRFGGGDKCLRILDGKTLLHRVLARAKPQVGPLILNASGDTKRFEGYELEIAQDCLDGNLGPLAGVLTGLEWARAHAPDVHWVASFATDAPFFPKDLVERLQMAAEADNARIAVAKYGGYTQPVFALWHVDLAVQLRTALVEEGLRKVMAWVHHHPHVLVEFTDQDLDPFFNINTADDLAKAETLLKKSKNK